MAREELLALNNKSMRKETKQKNTKNTLYVDKGHAQEIHTENSNPYICVLVNF